MKKILVIVTGLLLVTALAACGGKPTDEETAKTGSLDANYKNAISVPAQLALGSIKLEDTDLAIDEEQAAKLLPLWQGYISLYNSNTAATAEISALFKQIQEKMTAGQIEAIKEMKLTEDDSTAYVEEMGSQLTGGFVVRSESEAPTMGGMGGPGGGPGGGGGGRMPSGGGMPGGGMMGGGMPGGGMMMGGPNPFEQMSEEELAAAMESGDRMTASSDQMLISSLIRTLQTKAGGTDMNAMPGGGMPGGGMMFMDTISNTTGISMETLQAGVASGSTLADVITANGGDLDAVKAGLTEALSNSEFPIDDPDQFIDNLLNNSMQQMNPNQAPGDQLPGGQVPGDQAPGNQAPGNQAPGNQAPGSQAPATETPKTE